MNPMSIEMEQDWRGAGDGLIGLIVLFAYMAVIHKLFEWSRVSENVAKVLWGAACLLPLGYLVSSLAPLAAIGMAAFGLFYWFAGKEILSTTFAQRKNLEEIRRQIEIEDAKNVANPAKSVTHLDNSSSWPQNGIERNVKTYQSDSTKNIIVPCPCCGHGLRAPAGKSLELVCAKCRNQFLVSASGEIRPHKLFPIIETMGIGSVASFEQNARHREREPAAILSRCSVCGLEREVSRAAEGFHCTGCKAFNCVEGLVRTDDFGVGDLKRAPVCAVIGCNEVILPGKIVCTRHG